MSRGRTPGAPSAAPCLVAGWREATPPHCRQGVGTEVSVRVADQFAESPRAESARAPGAEARLGQQGGCEELQLFESAGGIGGDGLNGHMVGAGRVVTADPLDDGVDVAPRHQPVD